MRDLVTFGLFALSAALLGTALWIQWILTSTERPPGVVGPAVRSPRLRGTGQPSSGTGSDPVDGT